MRNHRKAASKDKIVETGVRSPPPLRRSRRFFCLSLCLFPSISFVVACTEKKGPLEGAATRGAVTTNKEQTLVLPLRSSPLHLVTSVAWSKVDRERGGEGEYA